MRSDHLSKHLRTHQAKKGGGVVGLADGLEAENSTGNLTANEEEDMGEMTTIEDQDELAMNETGAEEVQDHDGNDIIVGPESSIQ